MSPRAVSVVSPAAYVDDYPQGVVSYFGDDASSATVLVQFCASEDFNGDIFETQPKTFSASGATKADFIESAFNGKGAGYIRLKIVNDKEMTSYSSVIPYTPPALIDFMDYAMKEPAPEKQEEDGSTRSLIEGIREGNAVSVFIGPEGGFEPDEVEAAKAAGILPVSLGKRILRTETAALVVLSWLIYRFETC